MTTRSPTTATSSQLDSDATCRMQALDPQQSFIIQAPAGSGKTELLIQRYLVLLTQVAKPEHVLAVTFTKKACGEMRARLYQALAKASGPEPAAAHEQKTWQLARAVCRHAQRCGWNLTTIAQKLSIYTIDAMCQQFLRFSHPQYHIWTTYQLALQPEVLYEDTIQAFIAACSQPGHPCCEPFHRLLSYHQLDVGYLHRLFLSLLQTREQWLPHVVRSRHDTELIPRMEATIVSIQNHCIASLQDAFTNASCSHFLAVYCAHRASLEEAGCSCDMPNISYSAHDPALPGADWIALSQWLLTKQGQFRSRFTSTQGILAKKALQELPDGSRDSVFASQQDLLNILALMRANPELCSALRVIQSVPLCYEDPSHWEPLETLLAILPYLAAFLTMHMHNTRTTDFAQITLEVLAALHDEDVTPTLRERLFQSTHHLLVDECQDISISQYHIFSTLVAEWSGDRSRSATMVGDPMQSIYRFRQADVRLFGTIQQHGLGGLPLTPLYLEKNYRSQAKLVEWVNHCFSHIEDDGPYDLVNYPAIATRPALAEGAHWHACQDGLHEAEILVSVIQRLQQEEPNASIGLLVRARSQLKNILPALRAKKIACRSVGIDSLAANQSLLDCITLLLLPNLTDRLHWIALLRCPFAYVSWQDITLLAQNNQPTIWASISAPPPGLSSEAKKVFARICPILTEYLRFSARKPRGQLAKKIWHALGGPYALKNTEDYAHIEDFFAAVDNLTSTTATPLNQAMLTSLLAQKSVTESSPADNPVEIMTVHKSKGLEFDYVLCPALYHGGAPSRKPLLDWMHTHHQAEPELLMHAPPKNQRDTNSIHHYLRQYDSACDQQEQIRLCYVALTRARKGLHAFSLALDDKAPPARSWHARLQAGLAIAHPSLQSHTHTSAAGSPASNHHDTPYALPADWQHPLHPQDETPYILYPRQSLKPYQPISIVQQQDLTWGEIVHRFLQWVSLHGLAKIDTGRASLCALAYELGIHDADTNPTLAWIFSRLCALKTNPRAQWLFSPQHDATFIEKTMLNQDNHARYRCDLRLISDGILWIVDFKTAGVENHSETLPSHPHIYKSKYSEQLSRYQATAIAIDSSLPVKTALFFPLQATWIDVG